MASGSYKGAGINVPDLLLYAGLAVGAYFAYKTFFKPASDVTGAVGDVTSEFGQSLTAPQNTWQAGWGYLTNAINNASKLIGGGKEDNRQPTKTVDNSIKSVDTSNYITSITPQGTAYGVNIISAQTNKGQQSTVAQIPNTYYSNLGIGFDSKGNGYSSMTPLKA